MKKKVLFIDRDGTLIVEPPTDFQVDSLEKLAFYPGVIGALSRLRRECDYVFVMVTNQDGMGTPSFPEATFWPAHNKLLEVLRGEGIEFDAVHIDRSLPEDNAPTRKPETGMLTEYLTGEYDLPHSWVIGDRQTDVKLAQNLGAGAILLADTSCPDAALTTRDWDDIYTFLRLPPRVATVERKTSETDISVSVNLDGTGIAEIHSGIGFFDHMLDQIAKHARCDVRLRVSGDLDVDEHHTIEDTALALGDAFSRALGDKRGLERYGFVLPMDEAQAQVALDFSGRSWLVWNADFHRERIGEMPTEMFKHFFKSFSDTAHCTLHISAQGENEHHKIEAIFKAFGRALRMALRRNPEHTDVPSTKGSL